MWLISWTGALVALLLCHRVEHARGKLALLAAPVFIDGWSTPWYRALRHVLYHVPGMAERTKVEEGEPTPKHCTHAPPQPNASDAQAASGSSFVGPCCGASSSRPRSPPPGSS